MTQRPPEGPRMTRIVTRVVAAVALAAVLAGTVAACGRYGPPQPYPPEVEEDDDA